MRLSSQSSRFAVAVLLLAGASVACSDARATSADDEFARDLQLAASTVDLAMPPVDSARLGLENVPSATPDPAPVVRRAAGPRVVRSETPTVAAAPVEEIAEAETEEFEVIETVEAPAPVLEESLEPVAVAPRPTTPVIPAGGDYGGSSGGVFGGGGGHGGVVIRGGGVDGDNCELHRTGRRGPIYMPRPTASMPTMPTSPTVDRSVPRTRVGGFGGARSAGPRRTASAPASGGSTSGRSIRPRRIGG